MDGTIYVKPERIRQYVIDLFGYYTSAGQTRA